MSSTLKQNLSNTFYQRRNALTSNLGRITALVEDEQDVPFWSRMLHHVCPQKDFNVMPYQQGKNKTSGKNKVVETILSNGGPLYIGCVDSDLDLLLNKKRYPQGSIFFPTNMLFQTYCYSIENLYCLPESLNDIYTTLSSFQCRFNFVEFLKNISLVIYPLFMTDLYLRSMSDSLGFKVDDWSHVFPGDSKIKKALSAEKSEEIITLTEHGVNKYLNVLKGKSAYVDADYLVFKQDFENTHPFVQQDNCILFIYGHGLFDFIKSIVGSLQHIELQDAINTLHQDKSMDSQVKVHQESKLRKLQRDVETVLYGNYEFIHIPNWAYSQMEADLKNL